MAIEAIVFPGGFNWPLWIGAEKGAFAAEGVAVNLTALGIGAIIGTGIFVLTGTVAAQNAGPAVVNQAVWIARWPKCPRSA